MDILGSIYMSFTGITVYLHGGGGGGGSSAN